MTVRTAVEMTGRARAYLVIAGSRHLALGLAATLSFGRFDTPVYDVITSGVPILGWGVIFLLGGLHLMYAAAKGSEEHARLGLVISAVITSVWAAGLIAAWLGPVPVSPLGGILMTALTLKDLTVVRDPMRSPFEPIIAEYMGDDGDWPGGRR